MRANKNMFSPLGSNLPVRQAGNPCLRQADLPVKAGFFNPDLTITKSPKVQTRQTKIV
jgi:hypothetical protein